MTARLISVLAPSSFPKSFRNAYVNVPPTFHEDHAMLTFKNREGVVKVSIPRRLHMSILRLQVDGDLSWDEACLKAGELIDANSVEFKRSVKREAERIYNSRFMSQLNKAKGKEWEKGFEAGREEARSDYEVWFYCSVCGEKITITPNSESHKALINYMREHGWGHSSCHEKAKVAR